VKEILQDLKGEQDALDAVVSRLDHNGWATKTLFENWTVQQEIAHLAFFDYTARLSATDPDAFQNHAKGMASGRDEVTALMGELQKAEPADLLERWRKERAGLLEAMAPLGKKDRLPWYGPPMSAVSFATARLMETWAHGQDVVDVVDGDRPATDRLKHVAHLGNITFGWTFTVRQMDVPTVPIRVELTSPSGESWTWGPEDAEDLVRGSAEGFCLVVTQRRHFADTDLVATGETAEKWMSMAQCFAGPPATGPKAGTFPKMGG
jgi:uncharacterized protein (TIGR03084 family)